MAALVCMVCTDVSDNGNKYIYSPVDGFLGVYMVKFASSINGYDGRVPAAMTVIPGDSITLPDGDGLTIKNYARFGGWNTNSSGTNKYYAAGSSYKPDGNVTLYVKWIRTYTVKFTNGNNNSCELCPAAITADSGSSITLPDWDSLTNIRIDGYYFGGWNTIYTGSGTNYAVGSSYKPDSHVTLYAKWNEMSCVQFHADGGDGTIPEGIIYVMPGDSITLPDGSNLTKEGYYYGGWSDGNGNYADGSSYMPTGTAAYGHCNYGYLSAKWNAKYSVEFSRQYDNGRYYSDADGTAPATIYVMPGDSVTLPDSGSLTRDGYVFGGWNKNRNGAGTNYAIGSTYKPTGSDTLYAKWIAIYTVYFYENGGSGTVPETMYVISGDSITLPDKGNLTRSGYIFGGWNSHYDGKGTDYAVGSTYKPTDNVGISAKWIPTFTITFNARGGSVSPTSGVTSADGTLSFLPNPTKDADDIFGGWYMEVWGGTAVTTNTVFSRDTIVYAQWKFKDSRDGKTYKKVTIGNQTWMAENLNFDATGSVCYDNNSNNCAVYGRLYTWEAAKDACPEGWRLPTNTGWTTLENYVVGLYAEKGNKLKSTSGWYNNGNGSDDYGFSALPGGSGDGSGNFFSLGRAGNWWDDQSNTDNAWYHYISNDNTNVNSHAISKTNLNSVRCEQR